MPWLLPRRQFVLVASVEWLSAVLLLAESLASLGAVADGAVPDGAVPDGAVADGSLSDGLLAYYEANPPKGEIVLLVGPPAEEVPSDADAEAMLREALATMKTSQAAAHVAKATGLDRKTLYTRAMEIKAE